MLAQRSKVIVLVEKLRREKEATEGPRRQGFNEGTIANANAQLPTAASFLANSISVAL